MDTDAEIERLVRRFEDCTLPRVEWTHHAHLRVALWYLLRHPRDDATQRIRDGIKNYNALGGRPGGYHETITLAWIAVVSDFLAANDNSERLSSLSRRLIDECGEKDRLRSYYSDTTLRSEEARRNWVPPDLKAFGLPEVSTSQ